MLFFIIIFFSFDDAERQLTTNNASCDGIFIKKIIIMRWNYDSNQTGAKRSE